MMKASIVHLGCPKNQTLSEYLAGMVVSLGYSLSVPEESELVIINTCGFINPAKQESVDRILEAVELKKSGPVLKLIVTGCMAPTFSGELLSEIPEIDAVFPLDSVDRIPDYLSLKPEHEISRVLTTTSYAYLKIAEGCDHSCSFCLIPELTGRFRSRSVESLVKEASEIEEIGVSELVLVAQDTTAYGKDLGGQTDLTELLTSLLENTSFPWIRFMYAYPSTLQMSVVELMASEERLMPYLDIPLQHADGEILKSMERGGDFRSQTALIERIRDIYPEIQLRSTFIVGFPGENDEAFRSLKRFVESVRLNHMGLFPYDDDEKLASHILQKKIPEEIVTERIEELLDLQAGISLEHNRRRVGSELPLLADEVSDTGITARHMGMAPEIDGEVHLPADESVVPGDIIRARIVSAAPYTLKGIIV